MSVTYPSAKTNEHTVEPEDEDYSWVQSYLARLKGKEEREEYYALLEQELELLK
jgi:hypothetical protein